MSGNETTQYAGIKITEVTDITNVTESSEITEDIDDVAKELITLKDIKILVIGEPNSGKTSIIKSFFYGVDPRKIIQADLEPTMAVEISIFERGSERTAIFEIPGAQNNRYLHGEDAAQIFTGADGIITVFNTGGHNVKKWEKLLIRINFLRKKYCPRASVAGFFHKAEHSLERPKRKRELEKIIGKFKNKYGARFFITSIHEEFHKRFEYSMKLALLDMPKPEKSSDNSCSDRLLKVMYEKSNRRLKSEEIDVDNVMKRETIKVYEDFV
ncbi:MAG: hypothetical protein ACTSWY_10325 [Promethearchaeota archaeon]